jgi:chromodomain-helicase-DNA-binding protein 1
MVLEYSIISTMDTSGMGIMQKNGKKSKKGTPGDKITNEELQTILKFGAQNLFKQEENKDPKEGTDPAAGEFSKLEEMNLDDILQRAEVHEGVEQTGTALGSAEFLTQFNVADVAQMSWDELIPSNLREEPEESVIEGEIPEEFLFDGRRRTAPVSYKGADFSLDGGKKKRKTPKPAKKKGDDKVLSDKESKSLVRSYLKFGDFDNRLTDISTDADVNDKDPDVVVKFLKGMVRACEDAVAAAKSDTKPGKSKAITTVYGPVSAINASSVLQRKLDMEGLNARLKGQNLSSFRITWILKPVVNWAVPWTSKDDSMLLIGIFKHGYGSWAQMQADTELPFKRKFFLDPLDKSLPSAVHLSRRADTLLKSLREESMRKQIRSDTPTSRKLIPTPGVNPDSLEKKRRPSTGKKRESLDGKRRDSGTKKREIVEMQESEYESMDEAEYKNLFVPIKKKLRSLQKPEKYCDKKDEMAVFVKENLQEVGKFIKNHLAQLKDESSLAKTRKHLWKYASYFWPNEIPSRSYRKLCERMMEDSGKVVNTEIPHVHGSSGFKEVGVSFNSAS